MNGTVPTAGFPDAGSFDTPARRRLADAVRALNAAVLDAAPSTTQLDQAAAAAERALDALGRAEARAGDRRDATATARTARDHRDYLVRSPLLGRLHPSAPPFELVSDGPELHARGAFGAAHEGPPGHVHGGWLALALDEALGTANVSGGAPALTGRLTVRYRRPTPLAAEVHVDARTTRVDGRRITTRGSMTVDGNVTAEAEGLFVAIDARRAREHLGGRAPG